MAELLSIITTADPALRSSALDAAQGAFIAAPKSLNHNEE